MSVAAPPSISTVIKFGSACYPRVVVRVLMMGYVHKYLKKGGE